MVWLAFRERIYAAVIEAGFTDLNRTHVLAIRYPTLEGVRPTELAEQMNLSKQAINDVMRHLERCGYVKLEPDPADRRARLIRFTPRGHELMEFVREASLRTTKEWAHLLGEDRMDEVKRALADLLTAIAEVDAEEPGASLVY